MKIVLQFVLVMLVAYLGLCAFLFFFQRSLIYLPVAEPQSTAAESLWLETEGARIRLFRVGDASQHAIVYFGGNAEDVSGRATEFAGALPDFDVYLVNYRGYAGSSGSPTEVALYTDALAIFDHLASEYRSVSAIGRSLGAGVASFLAAERPLQKLVLVTPFDSVVEVAREQFSLFPVDLLVKDRFDAASHASRISMPTLVIIAAADEVIPRARSDALVSALGAAALSVQVIDSATHNTIDHHHQYLDSISQFMSGAAP